jgi:hypothetical protein
MVVHWAVQKACLQAVSRAGRWVDPREHWLGEPLVVCWDDLLDADKVVSWADSTVALRGCQWVVNGAALRVHWRAAMRADKWVE